MRSFEAHFAQQNAKANHVCTMSVWLVEHSTHDGVCGCVCEGRGTRAFIVAIFLHASYDASNECAMCAHISKVFKLNEIVLPLHVYFLCLNRNHVTLVWGGVVACTLDIRYVHMCNKGYAVCVAGELCERWLLLMRRHICVDQTQHLYRCR